jgi:hypothetical protein
LTVYIDIGAVANDNTVLNFAFTGAAVTTRSWDIRESQIECSNPNRCRYYKILKP